jgi:hypothetical protein
MGVGINANMQQSNGKAGGWQTTQREGATNITAKKKGQTMQDKRVMEKVTMQGDWVGVSQHGERRGAEDTAQVNRSANDMTRGGGRQRWWLMASGGGVG